jgi:hypothetical protein
MTKSGQRCPPPFTSDCVIGAREREYQTASELCMLIARECGPGESGVGGAAIAINACCLLGVAMPACSAKSARCCALHVLLWYRGSSAYAIISRRVNWCATSHAAADNSTNLG